MFRSAIHTARRSTQAGFTLAELCIALAVAGILVAIGMPSMASFHGNTVVATQAQELMSALRLARHEAVSRGELVSVCAMDPASVESDEPDCLARGQDWSAGWIVFIDRDRRGEIGANDRIVSIHQAGKNKGEANASLRYVTYRPAGEMLSFASHFRFLPPGQGADEAAGAALVCVNKTGRPRLAEGDDCRG